MAAKGGGIAARMAMLNLDPSKMAPGNMADFQQKMRDKEMARMEAEAKDAEERGEPAAGAIQHVKRTKMVGRKGRGGKKGKKPVVRKIKFENKEQERPNVLREIQGEEMLFIQQLRSVIDKFQKPILGDGSKFGLTDNQWSILTSVNKVCRFHERVRDGPLLQQKVAESFATHKEEMIEMHATYRKDLVKVLRLMHALRNSKMYSAHVKAMYDQKPPLHVAESYSLPLERMHHYRPLLERLLGCTNEKDEEQKDNPEYPELVKAVEWVKKEEEDHAAENEQLEESCKLLEMEQEVIFTKSFPSDFPFWRVGRRAIKCKPFAMRDQGKPQGNVTVYLCNDVLI